jgi:hypothetical protein
MFYLDAVRVEVKPERTRMSNVIEKQELAELLEPKVELPLVDLWGELATARQNAAVSYLDYCRAMARLYAAGQATQYELAKECELPKWKVAHMCCIGKDARFYVDGKARRGVPKSDYTLYQLSTLDDAGFDKLCRPDTTQQAVLDYKGERRTYAAADAAFVEWRFSEYSAFRLAQAKGATIEQIAEHFGLDVQGVERKLSERYRQRLVELLHRLNPYIELQFDELEREVAELEREAAELEAARLQIV